MVEEIVTVSQECVDRAKLDRELHNRMVRDLPAYRARSQRKNVEIFSIPYTLYNLPKVRSNIF